MAHYVTIEDLQTYIGFDELSDLAGVGSHNAPEGRSLDIAKIDKQIAFASDLINGYLSQRFTILATLDAAQMPELLRGYAADIVHYRLRVQSGNRNTVTDEVRDRYEDVIKWLKDASKGLVNLAFDEAVEDAPEGEPLGGEVNAIIPPSRAQDTLKGW